MTRSVLPRTVWILGLVSMLMDISSEMIHALLPVYLVTVLGVSMSAVGALEGAAEATAAFLKVFAGALSDRIRSRKWLAASGYGLSALTKPMFPLAATFGLVVAARIADRIGKGIRGAPRDALITDVTPPDRRGAAFGLRQSLDTIGAVVGPVLAIGLMWLLADDFRGVFWFAVVPAIAAFLLIAFAVQEPEKHGHSKSVNLSFRRVMALPRAYWAVLLLTVVLTLARFSEAFLILRATEAGLAVALSPLVLIAMNIVYTASAYPAGLLSDRVGRHGVLIVGIGVLILADVTLAVMPGLAGVALGTLLWGLHMGLSQGLLAALVADHAPEDLRGTSFGLYNFASGAALLAASLIAGFLWDSFGSAAAFLAGAGFAAVALLGLLIRR